jgi:hypothetical protein
MSRVGALMGFAARSAPLGWALLSWALLGCTKPSSSEPSRAAEDSTAHAPRRQPATGPTQKPIDGPEELREVSRLRGLPATKSVTLTDISREALKAHLEQTLESHMPERAMVGTEHMLFAFGAVPADFNYRTAIVGLMQSELAGLYDPIDDTMYLLADLAPEMRKATLLHELVHALQDQHYSLDRVANFAEDQTDRMSALSSLAEGDATSVMFDAVLAPEHKTALDVPISILERQLYLAAERPETEGVPRVLLRALLAPYVDGMAFVQALRERGGFAEVDRAWQTAPTSTEQILHLERYDAHEPALAVNVPPPPDATGHWTTVLHDVWGEQSWRVLLEEFSERSAARRAAEGWGGDRIVAYEAEGQHAVAAVLTLDSDADALEVEQLWLKDPPLASPPKSPPGSKTTAPGATVGGSPVVCHKLSNGAALAISRRARSVVFTAGPYVRAAPSPHDCERSIRYHRTVLATLGSPE